uniref:Uncharacterized protein n=1 Tax=Meloidogyne enterolobii TaxID=390850 RepID=A0A6V7WQZ9_MELEN|nr:unnamed protein product [Meloidogyne enterolobii]
MRVKNCEEQEEPDSSRVRICSTSHLSALTAYFSKYHSLYVLTRISDHILAKIF